VAPPLLGKAGFIIGLMGVGIESCGAAVTDAPSSRRSREFSISIRAIEVNSRHNTKAQHGKTAKTTPASARFGLALETKCRSGECAKPWRGGPAEGKAR
jgi:hypothetical protein